MALARLGFFFITVLGVLAVAGCGQPSPTASVSGKVYLVYANGKKSLVDGGSVLFHFGQKFAEGSIQEDGSYEVTGVWPGPNTVRVLLPEDPGTEDGDEKPAKKRRYYTIPDIYGDPELTPLKLEVKDGPQSYDVLISLK